MYLLFIQKVLKLFLYFIEARITKVLLQTVDQWYTSDNAVVSIY